MVNPILLTFTILFTRSTLRLVRSAQPLASSLSMMGIPFTWVLAGMALTEMPSIMLTALSTLLLVTASKTQADRPFVALVTALAAGVSLGIASLSRAMVLVVLAALPCLLIDGWRHSLRTVAAFAFGTMAVVGPIVLVWGGLVPPHSAVPVSATSFSLFHLILSIAYAATVMLILAPQWFDLNVRLALGISLAIFSVNAVSGLVEISVASSVVAHLPSRLAAIVPRLAGSVMIALAALFVGCSAKNLFARRGDPVWLFFCVSMLLLIASSGKIVHQYSSRYTGMASGMMILAADPVAAPTLWRVLGVGCGMLIGLSSLLSYYARFTP
jgi:4-amino-4-deoxy-L-arabinose transferase-like glycosyltransferase